MQKTQTGTPPFKKRFALLYRSRRCARNQGEQKNGQLLFAVATPSVKMGHRSIRRRSGVPKFKMIFPLTMAKAHAEAIPNRFTACVYQNIFSQVA